jgi:hypothetical protein
MGRTDLPPLDAGTTLAAADALQRGPNGWWTDEQVAYLIHLAYQTGRAHAAGDDLAEEAATWAANQPPAVTREQRVQERLDDMTRRYGPARYLGGPVTWDGVGE